MASKHYQIYHNDFGALKRAGAELKPLLNVYFRKPSNRVNLAKTMKSVVFFKSLVPNELQCLFYHLVEHHVIKC